MKAKLILFAALFIFFSCSNSDPSETVRAEKVSYDEAEIIRQDSINRLIEVYEGFLQQDEKLLADIEKAIEAERAKAEATNDLAKKAAYQKGVADLTKQKRGPRKRVHEMKVKIAELRNGIGE